MKACLDVYYVDSNGVAACVLFHDWTDAEPASEYKALTVGVAEYESGQFFRRELPCLLAVMEQVPAPIEVAIIDGYVWLDSHNPGLGAYLFDALDRRVPIIGVAKHRFARGTSAYEIRRGRSRAPLYVTSVGLETRTAAQLIQTMHGDFRLPTMLRRVDQISRSIIEPRSVH
jgi:deoxyribonuclease V